MKKSAFSVILILCMLLPALSGCSVMDKKSGEETVTKMFSALSAKNYDIAKKYVELDKLTANEIAAFGDTEAVMDMFFDKLSYKILQTSEIDGTVYVQTEITAVDMQPVVSEFLKGMMALASKNNSISNEELMEKSKDIFAESAKKNLEKTVQNIATIEVEKKDGAWIAVPNKQLVNALFGGVIDCLDKLDKSENGQKNEK